MSAALVSVVIPCFNQAAFLAQAIESVRAQAGVDTEVVVVDDGSTDGSGEVAAGFAGVVLHRQENAGLAAARNAGLSRCRGDFVVFLDADDLLLPGALKAGLACLEDHPESAFAWGRYRVVIGPDHFIDPPADRTIGHEAYRALLQHNAIVMHGTVIYRRFVLEAVGGFDPALRACEDYDLYLRIARHHPISQHDAVVAVYRKHGDNMSADSLMMLETVLSVLRAQRPHLEGYPKALQAYREGVCFWKSFYGARAIVRILRAVVRLDLAPARRDFARLCRILGPGSLLVHGPSWLLTLWRDTRRFRGTA